MTITETTPTIEIPAAEGWKSHALEVCATNRKFILRSSHCYYVLEYLTRAGVPYGVEFSNGVTTVTVDHSFEWTIEALETGRDLAVSFCARAFALGKTIQVSTRWDRALAEAIQRRLSLKGLRFTSTVKPGGITRMVPELQRVS